MRKDTDLIKAWILAQQFDVESTEYENVSWAVDELIEAAELDPERLWKLLPQILESDASAKTLGAIGAGLLEDLMVHHGEEFIDRVTALADSNLKKAMQHTFLDEDDVSPEVFNKFAKRRK